MALTASEQAELDQLNKEIPVKSGLSQNEQLELDQLNKEASGQPQEQGFLENLGNKALNAAVNVGKKVDQYTGAPVRAAIGAGMEGNNPLTAYGKQFGQNPDLAPTGNELAQRVGVSDKPIFDPTSGLDKSLEAQGFKIEQPTKGTGISPADVLGFGVDVVADPLAFVPIGKVIGSGAKAGEFGLNIAAKTAGKAVKGSAILADMATGTKAATGTVEALKGGLQAVERTGKGVSNVLETYLKPSVAGDFKKMEEIATKHGIDPKILPESIEFGNDSFISRASRAKAEGPLGGPKLEQFKEATRQVNDALTKKVSDISGVGGPLLEKDAGSLIRNGYDDGVNRFFSGMDTTYKQIAKNNPGLSLDRRSLVKFNDALSEIQSRALDLYKNPINAIEKSEAASILQSVDAVMKKGVQFDSAVDLLQRIGKYNFKSNAVLSSPIDAVANRRLYGELKDAIIKTVEKVDPKSAVDLIENNKAMTEFFGEQSSLAKSLGSKSISDEGLFKNLILNGDSKKIEALKSVLSPQDMQQLKASFIEAISHKSDEGLTSFAKLRNQLKNKESVVNALFNENEIKDIGELTSLGNRIGSPVMSSSGTGASNQFKDLLKSVPDSIISEQVIESMKAKARGVVAKSETETLNKAIDSLSGLTNEQAMNKINKVDKLRKARKVLMESTPNPRSKASQILSTQNKEDK